jgi:hypothetical protein
MSSNMILLAKSDMAQNWAACPNAYAGFGDIDPGRCDFASSITFDDAGLSAAPPLR